MHWLIRIVSGIITIKFFSFNQATCMCWDYFKEEDETVIPRAIPFEFYTSIFSKRCRYNFFHSVVLENWSFAGWKNIRIRYTAVSLCILSLLISPFSYCFPLIYAVSRQLFEFLIWYVYFMSRHCKYTVGDWPLYSLLLNVTWIFNSV